ncbi:MAG TPA: LysR substrate-binding domain-containing protein [Candidatus Competibacteraceae bacterium]|nr:LysR substrate-binding domain-containing protein [Candidatus Competibacteraceae bacterium]
MNTSLEDMLLFAEIVEQGSLTAVAQSRDSSRSLVSKRLKGLEQHLGVRLLNRTTRTLSLTEPGELLYRHSRRLRELMESAEAQISSLGQTPRGRLKLTVPVSLGERSLARLLADFLGRYPEIQVDLNLDERFVDLVEAGYDLAIRIGQLEDSSLIARRLGRTRLLVCAAPEYLQRHGVPRQPGDLARHNCLTYRHPLERSDMWTFQVEDDTVAVKVSSNLRSDNGSALLQAALAGLGLVYLPTFIVGPELRAGRLVAVLEPYCRQSMGIYAVYPSGSRLPAKTQVFLDYLASHFAAVQDWE